MEEEGAGIWMSCWCVIGREGSEWGGRGVLALVATQNGGSSFVQEKTSRVVESGERQSGCQARARGNDHTCLAGKDTLLCPSFCVIDGERACLPACQGRRPKPKSTSLSTPPNFTPFLLLILSCVFSGQQLAAGAMTSRHSNCAAVKRNGQEYMSACAFLSHSRQHQHQFVNLHGNLEASYL